MSLYNEASFVASAARGDLGFGGMRNPALEAWAYQQDQELIAAGRERRLAAEQQEQPAGVMASVVGAEIDFASVTQSVEQPYPVVMADLHPAHA